MSISLVEALHKIVEHVHWREESDYKAVRAAIDEHFSEEPSEHLPEVPFEHLPEEPSEQQTSEAETK